MHIIFDTILPLRSCKSATQKIRAGVKTETALLDIMNKPGFYILAV